MIWAFRMGFTISDQIKWDFGREFFFEYIASHPFDTDKSSSFVDSVTFQMSTFSCCHGSCSKATAKLHRLSPPFFSLKLTILHNFAVVIIVPNPRDPRMNIPNLFFRINLLMFEGYAITKLDWSLIFHRRSNASITCHPSSF